MVKATNHATVSQNGSRTITTKSIGDMSQSKQRIREAFRTAVFKRDGHKCRACKLQGKPDRPLDAHHITDRNLMPNGGYVKENGISLCPQCHLKAEEYHRTGTAVVGYSPDDLYKLIGSSKEKAIAASEKL